MEKFNEPLDGPFNLAEYLIDARVAEGRGDRVAIIAEDSTTAGDEPRRLTHADVQDEANRVANVLRSLGVAAGDRVLIALPDGPEFVAAFLGTLKAGAVVTMVNPQLPAADYAGYLSYTRARVLFADTALATRACDVFSAATHLAATVVVGDGCPCGRTFVSYRERVAGAPPRFTNAATRADDAAVWLFTSGSTGLPRAAVHRHRDFVYNIERYAKRILEVSARDVMLSVPRLFFGYGTGMSFMFPFAVGAATVLFADRPTPQRISSLAARHRATVLAAVPTTLAKMLDAGPPVGRDDLRSLRVVVSAGESLPADLYHRWKSTFGVEILDGLGSAEMFHIFISNRVGDVRPGCLGRLVPGYDAKVVAPGDGDPATLREVPDGELGALWVRGGSAAAHIEGDRERTARTLRDGWVVTSDLVKRIDGYFYYEGRSDDMLKVGGIYVSPLEVENVLLGHPAVAECAVVGYEDEAGLVKAKAYVVARDTLDDELEALWSELDRFARERLPGYKVPRRWEARATLPRSDRGKLLRRQLR